MLCLEWRTWCTTFQCVGSSLWKFSAVSPNFPLTLSVLCALCTKQVCHFTVDTERERARGGMWRESARDGMYTTIKHWTLLTGTAAISVGWSTEQSPLLPFLILVDWEEVTKESHTDCIYQGATKTQDYCNAQIKNYSVQLGGKCRPDSWRKSWNETVNTFWHNKKLMTKCYSWKQTLSGTEPECGQPCKYIQGDLMFTECHFVFFLLKQYCRLSFGLPPWPGWL